MPRVKIKKRDQIKFLRDLRSKADIDWIAISKQLKVCSRTVLYWRKAKYTIPEEVFKFFLKLTKGKIVIPSYKVLPDFWSVKKAGKKGGLGRFKKYGSLGTKESRSKGGVVSQQKRTLFPELYKHCNLRKIILKPEDSILLAEFVGIVLGDGSISNTQVNICLHKENDRRYISRVCGIIRKLFSIDPAIYYTDYGSHKNVADITISSTSFIDFLKSKGLKMGNKVKQQVDVPGWIRADDDFSKYCLRGLIDTDGCVYLHKHKSGGHDCLNIGLNFSNKSTPLLEFVYKTLKNSNFHPKIFANGVNLYREEEVCRYAKEIKFQNLHHEYKVKEFLNKKYH